MQLFQHHRQGWLGEFQLAFIGPWGLLEPGTEVFHQLIMNGCHEITYPC
jgi:hypothetical protein